MCPYAWSHPLCSLPPTTMQKLEDAEILVSFDVVYLFTNVPTNHVAHRQLAADDILEERTCLSVDNIKLLQLLPWCYLPDLQRCTLPLAQQWDHLAVLVSVTVVMEEIEEIALSSYPGTPPCYWKRYVDDTCTMVPIESLTSLHEHFNSIDEHIQFTVKKEENGSLPFLDSLLTHKSDGSISTLVCRKKTHTDQYLQFSSLHPLAPRSQ